MTPGDVSRASVRLTVLHVFVGRRRRTPRNERARGLGKELPGEVVVEDAEPLIGDAAEAPEQPTNPIGRVYAFYDRLSTTFSWRYVAIVSLVYGVNQGVGEACLFTAQKYYLFDDLQLTPARYSKVDGFANIPWQIKKVVIASPVQSIPKIVAETNNGGDSIFYTHRV